MFRRTLFFLRLHLRPPLPLGRRNPSSSLGTHPPASFSSSATSRTPASRRACLRGAAQSLNRATQSLALFFQCGNNLFRIHSRRVYQRRPLRQSGTQFTSWISISAGEKGIETRTFTVRAFLIHLMRRE